ncbi:MAG: laccase domain-containing protein, partial [Gammaproteobacteria bacterium]|nr:laccase domain-containing protein [Gammaproteobacteria bacterium]
LGVLHVYGGEFCTYTQEELFFSYRRDKGITGRMASLVWISRD